MEANISIIFDRESLRVMSECTLITESETNKTIGETVGSDCLETFCFGWLETFCSDSTRSWRSQFLYWLKF